MKFRLGEHEAAVARRVEALVAANAAERIWKRDATLWGGDAARQRSVANRLGWLDIASTMQNEAPALEAFASEIRNAGFTSAVLLGMGGSSLAPEVLRRSIAPREGYLRLYVLDTTDPETILGVERHVDLAHTLFFVSSKSGGTIEVASLFAYFHKRVSELKRDSAGENFVAVTDPGTSLQGLAEQHRFRRVFTSPPDIGGRYSALSYFGLVPAAVAGVDVARLLDAAIASAEAARAPDSDALRLGAALAELALAGRNKCTFVVARRIHAFGLWVEQLLAESTGKDGTGVLPVADEPLSTPKSYGDDRVFAQLRLTGERSIERDSMIEALESYGQPTVVIELDDEYDLGGEFFRWEFATAVAGLVLRVNPFDEPNVQESKENTARVLRDIESGGSIDDSLGAFSAQKGLRTRTSSGDGRDWLPREVAREIFDGLKPPAYLAINAFLPQSSLTDESLNEIRSLVQKAKGVATTLGYGPRFLHSTGQLHKGGPANGAFLVLTAEDQEDVAIPGKAYTFGQLKRAQALGDVESLRLHGRSVLRVHLGKDTTTGLSDVRDAVKKARNRRRGG